MVPTTPTSNARCYLVGGGIASLAAAVFLIRDAGVDGTRIRILEEHRSSGGALEASTAAAVRYTIRARPAQPIGPKAPGT